MAISTTGDEHRIEYLRQCVAAWDRRLLPDGALFVTVDGTDEEAERVRQAVFDWTGSVYRVGQPRWAVSPFNGRMGVAVNKNTGLELLMDQTQCEHLFLSDDDTWPLFSASLNKHIDLAENGGIAHSMVCWGKHRLTEVRRDPGMPDGSETVWASWSWPRGVMLYQNRTAVDMVGGMVEAFGPGGHEHVEYSRRMHNALMTPDDYCSPASYATRDGMGAAALWHAEDMRRPGEPLGNHRLRRRELTSVRRKDGDWEKINDLMKRMEGSMDYIPFRAEENRRASATLCESNRAEEPEKA